MIQFRHVVKHYGAVTAVDDVSLRIAPGEVLALLGASGCGKTTTLRLLAGLEAPDAGEIILNEQRVAGEDAWAPPEKRAVGMVFQDYALFPHLTIAGNIAFALRGWASREKKARITELLDLVGLPDMDKRYPHQLSGGQKQRVALARALAARPSVVLLDEPFSNLDTAMRHHTRDDVRNILAQTNATALFVTHDQEEAMMMASRIAVMHGGRILQTDTPRRLYENPASPFVARFLGDVNCLPAQAHGEQAESQIGPVPLREAHQGRVALYIRPEDLTLAPAEPEQAQGTVRESRYFGGYQLAEVVLVDQTTLQVNVPYDVAVTPNMPVQINVVRPVLAFAGD
ncbi:MAG: ABC transporter ATP-binding protein [Anaerolineales bacterium]